MAGHHKLRHCFNRAVQCGTGGPIFLQYTEGQWYFITNAVPETWDNLKLAFTGQAHAGSRYNAQWLDDGAIAPERARKLFAEYNLTRVTGAPEGITDSFVIGDQTLPPTNLPAGASRYPGSY